MIESGGGRQFARMICVDNAEGEGPAAPHLGCCGRGGVGAGLQPIDSTASDYTCFISHFC